MLVVKSVLPYTPFGKRFANSFAKYVRITSAPARRMLSSASGIARLTPLGNKPGEAP